MKEIKMYAYERLKGTFERLDLRCNQECEKLPNQKCEICGQPLTLGWTVVHGEAKCVYCGCPYIVYHYEKRGDKEVLVSKTPKVNVPTKLIPLYRKAWEQAETFEEFIEKAKEITEEFRKR